MSAHSRRLAAVIVAVAAVGCGGASGPEPGPAPEVAPVVPSGVDTLVATLADSLADASFVDSAEQDEASVLQQQGRLMVQRTDSLWLAMSALIDSAQAVDEADSLAARAAADEGGVALLQLDSLLRAAEDLDVEALARRTAMLLDSAELALETAFQLNPFDARSRMWLSQVYGLQARRLGQSEAYGRAIDELEKLALLTPDQHSVYAMLANNYFFVANWDGATLNYQKAEEVYLATFDLSVDDAQPLDSTIVFSYIQAQGDMHVQRLDHRSATEAYDRAYAFATQPEDSAYIAGELEWMAWDGTNIRSSFTRDSLLALEQGGDLESARRGYVDLLEELTLQSAVDETDWRLAIVEYNLGATEEAAARLLELVARTPTDSVGIPVDPAYERYLDDYGTLCLNLGRSFRLERRDNRTALKYFMQATQLNWSGRAVAYLEVATVLQSNLTASQENAAIALEGEDTLSDPQRQDLYRLLMDLSRRTGDFDKARFYRDAYRALRGR